MRLDLFNRFLHQLSAALLRGLDFFVIAGIQNRPEVFERIVDIEALEHVSYVPRAVVQGVIKSLEVLVFNRRGILVFICFHLLPAFLKKLVALCDVLERPPVLQEFERLKSIDYCFKLGIIRHEVVDCAVF